MDAASSDDSSIMSVHSQQAGTDPHLVFHVARSEVSRSSVIRWDAASSPEDSTPPSPQPSMPQLAKTGIRKLLQDSPSPQVPASRSMSWDPPSCSSTGRP